MEIKISPIKEQVLYTNVIQKAIDSCCENGGGTVVFTKGVYKTGTIFLKSNVKIYLEFGSQILASENPKDYPANVYRQMYKNESHMDRCLFFAKDCENIGFDGVGEVNGNGANMPKDTRPMLFRYFNCTNIRVENIKMYAPAAWTNAFIGCSNIWIKSVDIKSIANINGDGTDFDGCQNVFVSDSKFRCSDDCICLQNSFDDRVCENVVVTNCIFETKWAGLRIGLLSCNTIKDLTVSNCIFRNIECSGLKIQSSEGATIENMTFTNLVMENVVRPFFITANRFRERVDTNPNITTPSILKNMIISNVVFKLTDENFLKNKTTQPKCITIDCEEGNVIENLLISNVLMTVLGEGEYKEREIPTHKGVRAECFNYKGLLPAYGLFARNVKDLKVENLKVNLIGQDSREKIVIM